MINWSLNKLGSIFRNSFLTKCKWIYNLTETLECNKGILKILFLFMLKIQTDIKIILCGAPQNFSQKGDAKQTNKRSSSQKKT